MTHFAYKLTFFSICGIAIIVLYLAIEAAVNPTYIPRSSFSPDSVKVEGKKINDSL